MGEFLSFIYTKYALNNEIKNAEHNNVKLSVYKVQNINNKKTKTKTKKERKKKLRERKILKLLLLLLLLFYQTIIFIIKNLHVDKLINNNCN